MDFDEQATEETGNQDEGTASDGIPAEDNERQATMTMESPNFDFDQTNETDKNSDGLKMTYDQRIGCKSLLRYASHESCIGPSDNHPGKRWLSSFVRSDPRWQIAKYFDEVATKGRPGRGSFCGPTMAKKASIFTAWRPTSQESIKNMMRGAGTGKGMDVKGKSARAGNISSYVPFVQISLDEHKDKIIQHLDDSGTVRIYYDNKGDRDKAQRKLMGYMSTMLIQAQVSLKIWNKMDTGIAVSEAEEELAMKHLRNNRDNLRLKVVDDFSPSFFGIDVSERLFWHGYVMKQDCSRGPEGTEWFINRSSDVYNMCSNLKSTRKKVVSDKRRVVVYQKKLGKKSDENPMEPRTLLVAYEENGTILPVVSDFDLFLLGSRGLEYNSPISTEHLQLMQWLILNIGQVLEDQNRTGERIDWSKHWQGVILESSLHYNPKIPPFGHADPVLSHIIENAAESLKANGCVRHGPECFNLHFPQPMDEEPYLVVCDALPSKIESAVPWKYMKTNELQELLMDMIDDGFTFPINPKWVLCDPGWKRVWDKLTARNVPNVQHSLDCWFPPENNIREQIERISAKYPHGLNKGLGNTAEAAIDSGRIGEIRTNRSSRRSTISQDFESALLKKVRDTISIVQEKNHSEEDNSTALLRKKMRAAQIRFNAMTKIVECDKAESKGLFVKNVRGVQAMVHLAAKMKEADREETEREVKKKALQHKTLLKVELNKILEKSKDPSLDLRKQILACFDKAVQENSEEGLPRKADIFTVWIDKTPEEAIRKMMLGMGSGRGGDIKTCCATKGSIKSHIPFILSYEEKHKEMLLNSLRNDQVFRVFYPNKESQLEAMEDLLLTKEHMVSDMYLINSEYSNPTEDDLFMGGRMIIAADHLRVDLVDDHATEAFGLDVSEPLLWEAYVMQRDCSRPEGSEWDVGIKSPVAHAQRNIETLQKMDGLFSAPKAAQSVLYQIKESSPMEPRTLVMAYEECGDVRPVVEGFDCFLFGTRGVHYETIGDKQVELMKWSIENVEDFLRKQKLSEQPLDWSEAWYESLEAKRERLTPHLPAPQYGTSGPTSYNIFESAIEQLHDTGSGCVRRAAECFNLISPQPMEDRFLIICDTLPGDTPWKHVNLEELQDFLCAKIDEGFTMPLNPKWILCDPGWRTVHDKLLENDSLNMKSSIKSFPPESGIMEEIDRIWNKYSRDNLVEDTPENGDTTNQTIETDKNSDGLGQGLTSAAWSDNEEEEHEDYPITRGKSTNDQSAFWRKLKFWALERSCCGGIRLAAAKPPNSLATRGLVSRR